MSFNLIRKRAAVALGLLYVVAFVIVIASGSAASDTAALFGKANTGYSSLSYAELFLLFIHWPILFAALQWIWFGPGVFLAWKSARGVCDLVVKSFAAAFFIHLFSLFLVKAVDGSTSRTMLIAATAAIGVISWLYFCFNSGRAAGPLFPMLSSVNVSRILIVTLIPIIGLILLHPYIFWQSFNPDGVEALLLADSLNFNWFPRLATPEGVIGIGTGVIAPSYPFHFLLTFIGASEAAVRLPFLMYLPVIFCLLCELSEWKSDGKLSFVGDILIVLALSVFVLAVAFSAGYDFYAADISAPGSEDGLLVIAVLGLFLSLFKNEKWPLAGFLVLGTFTRPTIFMFVAAIAAGILILRFDRKIEMLRNLSFGVVLSVIAALAYQLLYVPAATEAPSAVPGGELYLRMRYLNLLDWWKLLIIAVSSGIAPFFALFFFRSQDRESLLITFAVVLYAGFFYFQAFTALHHYFPAMILPVVVFWRLYLNSGLNENRLRTLTAISFAGCAFAFWLSLPSTFEIERQAHEIGAKTVINTRPEAGELRSYKPESEMLDDVAVGVDWLGDPKTEYLSSTWLTVYYSERNSAVKPYHNYALLKSETSPPKGMKRKAESGDVALYVRDERVAERDRSRIEYTDYRSRVYAIPFDRIFAHRGIVNRRYDVDLVAVWRRIRKGTKKAEQE